MDTKTDDFLGSVEVKACSGWVSSGEMGFGGDMAVKDVPSKTRPRLSAIVVCAGGWGSGGCVGREVEVEPGGAITNSNKQDGVGGRKR